VRKFNQAWLRRRGNRLNERLSDEAFVRLIESNGTDPLDVLKFPERVAPSSALARDLSVFTGSPYGTLAERAARHEFDLLGSGPVAVGYETSARGAFGSKYSAAPGPIQENEQITSMRDTLSASSRAVGKDSGVNDLSQMLEAGSGSYSPIDWHVDFKSGHRWDPRSWWFDAEVGPAPGADIKIPWELSRSHHLVTMAIDGETGGDFESRAAELYLQVLDWVVANPTPMGVNWRSPMDVSIRAANWLWAFAISNTGGRAPDAVLWLVAKSLYEHGTFIESHLEWAESGTNNHYLADVTGLLQIASAFPAFPQSPAWTALGVQELVSEMDRSVNEDGTNYENSTGYHALVTEMFIAGTLNALRLTPEQRSAATNAVDTRSIRPVVSPRQWAFNLNDSTIFPDWYWRRLEKMIEFSVDISKPNGLTPQIGDQDDGRYVAFHRSVIAHENEPGWARDHRHLAAIGGELFDRDDWRKRGAASRLDMVIQGAGLDLSGLSPAHITPDTAPRPAVQGSSRYYPNGGYWVGERGDFWVGVRCAPDHQSGPQGHRHHDQLSFELSVRGVDIVVDPGSGVYTADPMLRREMRSQAAHSSVHLFDDADELDNRLDLFELSDETGVEVVEHGDYRIVGERRAVDRSHRREITLDDGAVRIVDEVDGAGRWRSTIVFASGTAVRVEDGENRFSITRGNVSLRLTVEGSVERTRVDTFPVAEAYGTLVDGLRLSIDSKGRRLEVIFDEVAIAP